MKIYKKVKKVGMTPEDYEKIDKQARSLGMSITEYLKYSGFDTTALGSGYTYLASDIYVHIPEEWLGSCDGYEQGGIKTYTMNTKYTELQNVPLYSRHKVKIYWHDWTDHPYFSEACAQGVAFVFFELDE